MRADIVTPRYHEGRISPLASMDIPGASSVSETLSAHRSSRRDFLRDTALAAAGVALGAHALHAKDEVRPPLGIIDTHTHFYDPTRPQGVPWPGKDDKVLYRRVLPADYKAIAEPLGITGTVVVEASPWVEDNQWLLDLADKDPFLVGIIGNLDPRDAKFTEHLERFAKNKLFRGIRINNGILRDEATWKSIVAALGQLVDHDLELDVNGGPDMPPDVARLAEALPQLRIVINHCANVKADGGPPPAAWRAGMQAAARHPHVICKVSALVEGVQQRDGKPPAEFDFYRPVIDVLWSAFGEDRLIFGSNWPVSERFAPLSAVHQLVARYYSEKGQTATEKYFRRNAQTAYKWIDRLKKS